MLEATVLKERNRDLNVKYNEVKQQVDIVDDKKRRYTSASEIIKAFKSEQLKLQELNLPEKDRQIAQQKKEALPTGIDVELWRLQDMKAKLCNPIEGRPYRFELVNGQPCKDYKDYMLKLEE